MMVPSSTRTPLGSVTVISFASANSGSCPVIVTLVGETDNVDPLMGEVLTNELANDALVPKKVSKSSNALPDANFLTFAFLEAPRKCLNSRQSSHLFRLST
jgi:hypothetical protein